MEKEKSLNPWVFIWFAPKDCLRRMLDSGQKRMVIWLAVIAGFFSGCSSLILRWGKYAEFSSFKLISVVFAEIAISIALSIVYLYVLSWVYKWAGRWINGRGDYISVKTAIGWSLYPWSVTSILGTIVFLMENPLAQRILGAIYLIIAIWSFIVFLHLLAEAHRFSVWRAFGAFAIMLGIVVAVAIIIGILVSILRTT